MNNCNMEAVLLQRSLDQPISPYKSHIRNPNKIHHSLVSGRNENFLPSHFRRMGPVQAPPPFLYNSQPPLLPLPGQNIANRSISSPPANRKANNSSRTRDSSLTPKKSKFPKREEKNLPKRSSECVLVSSANFSGHDPKELLKDVAKVLPFHSSGNIHANSSVNTNSCLSSLKAVEEQEDMFSGSVMFTVSPPPPSSLPLPTFSLRPKLSCKDEAAGINAGATDNLRRLLRLP